MQDCWKHHDPSVRGLVSIRWCEEHETWIIAAWAKVDGDTPFVDVHPMWLKPRTIADGDEVDGTLSLLLKAVQQTVQRLERESASGQMTLW